MLHTLLEERFRLSLHRETREVRVYTLMVDRNGPKLKPAKSGSGGIDLNQFAARLSVQLSIAPSDDRAGREGPAGLPFRS